MRPAHAALLGRVKEGQPISAEEENLLRSLTDRYVDFPDSISDSGGTRVCQTVVQDSFKFVEITHIDDSTRSFYMKDYGVAIGKLLDFDTTKSWNKKYDDSILQYENKTETVDDVFVGFVDQSKGGIPGQRYIARSYGFKTCGDLDYPLVMVEGGSPCTAVLAEDHPGCGVVFEVWPIPIWDPTAEKWSLTEEIWDLDGCDGSYKLHAIDLREGVPQPDKYATGLFAPRLDMTYGIILEVIDLDCESPGSCRFCAEA